MTDQVRRGRRWLAVLATSTLCVSCGGGGSSYGGGGAAGGGGGGTVTVEANFASIQSNVFTPICTECHAGAQAPLGLRLDSANSYGLLVGVQSSEQPGLARVAPGDPDGSYLIRKVEGTAAVGGRMPLDRTALPAATIAAIRQWITDGAQPTAPATPPSAPIRVTSLSPLPNDRLRALPQSVIALFDRELDATSVDATTFVLERSGGDGTFGDGNEVAVTATSISVPSANPSSAVFDLSGVASVDDTYRVTLAGSGGATIRDLASNALDGEYSGAFPSGDGTQGGDFVATFVVEAVQPTLASIQANLFDTTCAVACHTGPTSSTLPAGLDLSSASASLASLVGTDSIEIPSIDRVSAGDPDVSYLIQKLEGTAASGARMPLNQPPLDQATIDAVRQWITNGANP
jgi:Bacterial Ig-like domain